MKKYNKIQRSLIGRHKARFFATAIIIMLSIGLVSGVGASTYKNTSIIDQYYEQNNVSDLVIKSKKMTGVSKTDLTKIKDKYGEENVSEQFFYEIEESLYRVHALSLSTNKINKLDLIEGTMPSNDKEILAERQTSFLNKFNVGEKLSFLGSEYTISGIVVNPYYFQKQEEPMLSNSNKTLKGIFYMNKSGFLPTNDVYIKCSSININSFSDEYLNKVNDEKKWVLSNISDVEVLTLKECPSFVKLYDSSEKVRDIGWVILVVFMLVSALVILTIISRLVEEERGSIATLKTLGYSDYKISKLFFIFAMLASLIGILCSWPIGFGFSKVILINYAQLYLFPNIGTIYNNIFFIVALGAMLITSIGTSIIACIHSLKEKPADMLRKKAPKAGKKILLEKISFIWNKLSFKKKCVAKNIFRNKKNLIMTLCSIAGTSILVYLGLALMSYSYNDPSKGEALRAVCLIVLVVAILLTGVIIYVLTNINISERKREIATFMVLGYHDKEVEHYIFKEVYIITIFSSLVGLPIGVGVLYFIFNLLSFGSLALVDWWVYIVAPGCVVLFTFITTMLLKKSIDNIDMNDSLKSLE